jgi:hypothetical protein
MAFVISSDYYPPPESQQQPYTPPVLSQNAAAQQQPYFQYNQTYQPDQNYQNYQTQPTQYYQNYQTQPTQYYQNYQNYQTQPTQYYQNYQNYQTQPTQTYQQSPQTNSDEKKEQCVLMLQIVNFNELQNNVHLIKYIIEAIPERLQKLGEKYGGKNVVKTSNNGSYCIVFSDKTNSNYEDYKRALYFTQVFFEDMNAVEQHEMNIGRHKINCKIGIAHSDNYQNSFEMSNLMIEKVAPSKGFGITCTSKNEKTILNFIDYMISQLDDLGPDYNYKILSFRKSCKSDSKYKDKVVRSKKQIECSESSEEVEICFQVETPQEVVMYKLNDTEKKTKQTSLSLSIRRGSEDYYKITEIKNTVNRMLNFIDTNYEGKNVMTKNLYDEVYDIVFIDTSKQKVDSFLRAIYFAYYLQKALQTFSSVQVDIGISYGDGWNNNEKYLNTVRNDFSPLNGFAIFCASENKEMKEKFLDIVIDLFESKNDLFGYNVFSLQKDCNKPSSYFSFVTQKQQRQQRQKTAMIKTDTEIAKKNKRTLHLYCAKTMPSDKNEMDIGFQVQVL